MCGTNGRGLHDSVGLEGWLRFWSGWIGTVADEAGSGASVALERMKASAAMSFDALDADGDGLLSAEEYGHELEAWGIPIEPKENFACLDLDGDGVITRDDGIELIKEFFLSNDPEAPGNYLYGPPFGTGP